MHFPHNIDVFVIAGLYNHFSDYINTITLYTDRPRPDTQCAYLDSNQISIKGKRIALKVAPTKH